MQRWVKEKAKTLRKAEEKEKGKQVKVKAKENPKVKVKRKMISDQSKIAGTGFIRASARVAENAVTDMTLLRKVRGSENPMKLANPDLPV